MYDDMFDVLLPMLQRLESVAQEPRFHPEGNALYHSLQVFSLAQRDASEPALLVAALFHDLGKAPEAFFVRQDWPYRRDDVLIRRGADWRAYQHIHLDADYPIELTIYPRHELRIRARSSTDGKPIVRLTIHHVQALLAEAL